MGSFKMFLCPLPPFFGQKSPPKSVKRHKARQSATKRESGQKCVNQETLSHFHTFTLSHFHTLPHIQTSKHIHTSTLSQFINTCAMPHTILHLNEHSSQAPKCWYPCHHPGFVFSQHLKGNYVSNA